MKIGLILLAVAGAALSSLPTATPPVSVDLASGIVDALPQPDCRFNCLQCGNPAQHQVLVGEKDGPYGFHPEACTSLGSCADHDCRPDEDQDSEEVQIMLADLEAKISQMGPSEIALLVSARPDRVSLNFDRAAVQVRMCPQKIALSVPVGPDVILAAAVE